MLRRLCLPLLIISLTTPAVPQDAPPAGPVGHGLDTTATPDRYPAGIEAVVVAGRLALDRGTLQPARGVILRG